MFSFQIKSKKLDAPKFEIAESSSELASTFEWDTADGPNRLNAHSKPLEKSSFDSSIELKKLIEIAANPKVSTRDIDNQLKIITQSNQLKKEDIIGRVILERLNASSHHSEQDKEKWRCLRFAVKHLENLPEINRIEIGRNIDFSKMKINATPWLTESVGQIEKLCQINDLTDSATKITEAKLGTQGEVQSKLASPPGEEQIETIQFVAKPTLASKKAWGNLWDYYGRTPMRYSQISNDQQTPPSEAFMVSPVEGKDQRWIEVPRQQMLRPIKKVEVESGLFNKHWKQADYWVGRTGFLLVKHPSRIGRNDRPHIRITYHNEAANSNAPIRRILKNRPALMRQNSDTDIAIALTQQLSEQDHKAHHLDDPAADFETHLSRGRDFGIAIDGLSIKIDCQLEDIVSSLNKTPQMILFPSYLIDDMLFDTQYRTFWETKKTATTYMPAGHPDDFDYGLNDTGPEPGQLERIRHDQDQRMFPALNSIEDTPTSLRPKYTMINLHGTTMPPTASATYHEASYGNCALILRQDVKHRSTFSQDDSLGPGYRAEHLATHRSLSVLIHGITNHGTVPKSLMTGAIGYPVESERRHYFESQVMGPVSFSQDVEAIVVDAHLRQTERGDKFVLFSYLNGIPLYWNNDGQLEMNTQQAPLTLSDNEIKAQMEKLLQDRYPQDLEAFQNAQGFGEP